MESCPVLFGATNRDCIYNSSVSLIVCAGGGAASSVDVQVSHCRLMEEPFVGYM